MVGEKKGLFGREEVDPGVCFAVDLVTRAAREVASAPPSADLPLPEASGSSCVSGPMLAGVGVETGSLMVGIVLGVLKGLRVILSSSLIKEGRTRGLGVTNEIGSGVEPVPLLVPLPLPLQLYSPVLPWVLSLAQLRAS